MRVLSTCLLALAVWSPTAFAHSVRGTLRTPAAVRDEPAFQPYAGHASSMAGHARAVRGAVTDAVVWLEGVSAQADSGLSMPASNPKLAQKDQSFAPRVVAIPVGGSVDFPNLDPIYHNVFSVSPTRRFDLGKYPRGESRTVRFPKAGLVNVYCDIHSDMAGFILVTPTRALTRPRADGSWQLPDLPPGHYTLHWWHPDFGAGQKDVALGAEADLTVDLGY
jgi:plastocyanin